MCTKSSVIWHKTRNQQVAKLSVKYYVGLLFNRQTKGLHVNSTRMLFKISPLNFHARVHALRWHCHCPIAAEISPWSSSAHTWSHQCFNSSWFAVCLLSLAWYSRENSQQGLSPLSSRPWNPCQCTVPTTGATAWQTLCQVKASHCWWVCNKIHRAEIIPEPGASKIVKISHQMAKFCQKLKWLLFFLDMMYIVLTVQSSDFWLIRLRCLSLIQLWCWIV